MYSAMQKFGNRTRSGLPNTTSSLQPQRASECLHQSTCGLGTLALPSQHMKRPRLSRSRVRRLFHGQWQTAGAVFWRRAEKRSRRPTVCRFRSEKCVMLHKFTCMSLGSQARYIPTSSLLLAFEHQSVCETGSIERVREFCNR